METLSAVGITHKDSFYIVVETIYRPKYLWLHAFSWYYWVDSNGMALIHHIKQPNLQKYIVRGVHFRFVDSSDITITIETLISPIFIHCICTVKCVSYTLSQNLTFQESKAVIWTRIQGATCQKLTLVGVILRGG